MVLMGQNQINGKYYFAWTAFSLLQLCISDAIFHDLRYTNATVPGKEDLKEHCPSGWVALPTHGRCFRFVGSSNPWDKAEACCNNYGGHLAALQSPQELHIAQRLCNDSVKCWIGGRSLNTSAGSGWRWLDGLSPWNTSFPSGNISVNSCTLVAVGSASLVADNCNKSHAFICMLHRDNKCLGMRCHREYLIILTVVSGLILCTTLAVVIWLLAYRRTRRHRRSRKQSNQAVSSPPWKVFSKEELKSITKNFSEGNRLLGDAKTGSTYNGVLPDGSRVAVKRLKSSNFQRKKEFYSEIGRVARLRHPNIVGVKGCCYDRGNCYIVHEFIGNGPLDRWLYHMPKGGRSLDWGMRLKIATTLAQGIAFVHDKVKPHAVHGDIRASNVLVDEEFGAHLMGVGASKFVPWEVVRERGAVVAGGTHGYLAPEFVYRNELTTKSDVYSFGVLLLEIVSGRRSAQPAPDSVGWQSIFEWATPLVQSHQYMQLLDPLIASSPSSSSCPVPEAGVVQKVVDLVYACTQPVPMVRPRMSYVVHQLQQVCQQPPNSFVPA